MRIGTSISIVSRVIRSIFTVRSLFSSGAPGAWWDAGDLTDAKLAYASSGIGAEKITNGSFTTDTGWTKESGWSISGGLGVCTSSPSINVIYQSALTSGVVYQVTFTIVSFTGGVGFSVYAGGSRLGLWNAPGTYTYTFTQGATALFGISCGGGGTSGTIDNISVKALPTNAEFLAQYPNHALYKDSAGTLAVKALGDPVGLVLDKHSPVTSYKSTYFDGTVYADFPFTSLQAYAGDVTIEAWFRLTVLPTGTTFDTSKYILGGNPSFSNPGTDFAIGSTVIWFNQANYTSRTLSGAWTADLKWHHVAVTRSVNAWTMWLDGVSIATATSATVFNGTTTAMSIGRAEPTGGDPSGSMTGMLSNVRIVKGTSVYTTTFTPPTSALTAISGTVFLGCQNGTLTDNSSLAATVTNYGTVASVWNPFDRTGNHLIQPTAGARPAWGRRVNLLTYTEDFSNAAWGVDNVTKSYNQTVAPDGTNTAAAITEGTGSHRFVLFQVSNGVVGGNSVASVYLKKRERNFAAVQYSASVATTGRQTVVVDLTLGTVTATYGTSVTAAAWSISSAGNGWWRVSVSAQTVSAAPQIGIAISDSGTPTINDANYAYPIYTGDGTSGIYLWHPQLNYGTTADRYQRVTTATDYDYAGFPSKITHNGSTQFLYTASTLDLSATDKVTVFAGVQKLNTASYGTILETSTIFDLAGSTGSLYLGADIAADKWHSGVHGSGSTSKSNTLASYASPVSNVLSNVFDISTGTSANQIKSRVNGGLPTLASVYAGPTGTGNFGNYTAYVGARAGTSLWFNGSWSEIIPVGKLCTDTEMRNAENVVRSATLSQPYYGWYGYPGQIGQTFRIGTSALL